MDDNTTTWVGNTEQLTLNDSLVEPSHWPFSHLRSLSRITIASSRLISLNKLLKVFRGSGSEFLSSQKLISASDGLFWLAKYAEYWSALMATANFLQSLPWQVGTSRVLQRTCFVEGLSFWVLCGLMRGCVELSEEIPLELLDMENLIELGMVLPPIWLRSVRLATRT